VRRRFVILAALTGCALTCGPFALARNPRLEHLALNTSDMRVAASALLRTADLAAVPPGWRPLQSSPDDSPPLCPWQDYSSYTLTGRAESSFQATRVGGAGFVGSTVDVYSSTADARGRFGMDAHSGTAACESKRLRTALGPGLTVLAARQLPLAELGDHATAFEFVYTQSRKPQRIYVNTIELVRGRYVAVIESTNFDTPGSATTRLALARAVDRRLP